MSKIEIGLVAGVLGIVLGIAFAYLMQWLDGRVSRKTRLERQTKELAYKVNTLKNQSQCAANGGHRLRYSSYGGPVMFDYAEQFFFKCERCNLLVELRRGEVTSEQKKALVTLGVIKEEKKAGNK